MRTMCTTVAKSGREETRTHDLTDVNRALYPTELLAQRADYIILDRREQERSRSDRAIAY